MTQPTQDQGRTVAAAAAQGRPFPGAPSQQGTGAGSRPSSGRPPSPSGYGQQPGYPPPSGYGPRDGGGGGGSGGGEPDQEHSGWLLPSPEALAQYERIHPGMAQRIIALAEQEARFRWDSGAETTGGSTDRIAQLLALVIIMLFFAAGIYLIASGKQVAGCIISVVDLIALISVFATSGRLVKR